METLFNAFCSQQHFGSIEYYYFDFFRMLGNALKITIILIAWISHCSAQFDLKNYPNIPGYYDSELYDRYRIRRHFMPQRFGKRYTRFVPQRFGKRLYEMMNR
ncbi:unnamed protein product [Schistosoma margrebowiei]|uniref:Uncharacterized protein n=1 Tax=Schistosoma margrebowiei TaxID=48269 RepID=A0AA85AP38_9TREM|nr:unnamed protein product [Schistosoma margrebowiei]